MSDSAAQTLSGQNGLLFGAYRQDGADTFVLLATGQSLSILCYDADADAVRMRYADPDGEVEFEGRFPPTSEDPMDRMPPRLVIDLRQEALAELRSRYGLWRRITWFLLDAILVWFEADGMPHREVTTVGGWLNGLWTDRLCLQSGVGRSTPGCPKLFDWPVARYSPTPLDRPAPHWRFRHLQGEPIVCEVWLDTREGPDGQPVLDETIPLADQIGNVPRFVSDDGAVLFFNRVRPVLGPEYYKAGEPDYGLLGPTHVHYFKLGDWQPIAPLVRRAELEPFANLIPAQAIGPGSAPGEHAGEWLHPLLREELFFASLEAHMLTSKLPSENLPAMCSRDFEYTCKVGAPRPAFKGSPVSIGLHGAYTREAPLHLNELFFTAEDKARKTAALVAQYTAITDGEKWLSKANLRRALEAVFNRRA